MSLHPWLHLSRLGPLAEAPPETPPGRAAEGRYGVEIVVVVVIAVAVEAEVEAALGAGAETGLVAVDVAEVVFVMWMRRQGALLSPPVEVVAMLV